MRTALLLIAFSGLAVGQEVWTLRLSPQNAGPTAAAGFPGLYLVTTGTTSSQEGLYKAYRSIDGLTWSETALPLTTTLISGAGEITGAGADVVWRTTDGIAFTKSVVGSTQPYITGIAFGDQCMVAVGSRGEIFKADSPQGPWLPQLSPAAFIYGVAYGSAKFMASAGDDVLISPDGISWTIGPQAGSMREIRGFSDGAFFGNFGFLRAADLDWMGTGYEIKAAGAGWFTASLGRGISIAKISEAHISEKWSLKPSGFTDRVSVIAFGGNLWVAASENCKISTSPLSGLAPLAAPPVSITSAVEISWPSVKGRWYQVQKSTDNVVWTDVGLPLVGDGATKKFTTPTNIPRQFFKVKVQ